MVIVAVLIWLGGRRGGSLFLMLEMAGGPRSRLWCNCRCGAPDAPR